jgi:DNA polymerase delta subunit 2
MLEDESGRIRLVGDEVQKAKLVTGVIIGVLGSETPNGEFEVLDIIYAGIAPQTQWLGGNEAKMDVDGMLFKC